MRNFSKRRGKRRQVIRQEALTNSSNGNGENTESQNPGVEPQQAKKKSPLMKALMKILMYVVVFFIFRNHKTQDSNDGNDISDMATEDNEDDKPLRWFTASDNTTIFVVQDFLPLKVAERLRGALNYEWQKDLDGIESTDTSKPDKDENMVNESNDTGKFGWMFTTLKEESKGQSFTKEKERSLQNIPSRNESARALYNDRMSSYAAWELESSNGFNFLLRKVFMKNNGVEVSLNYLLKWKRDSSTSLLEKLLTVLLLRYDKIEKDISISELLDVSVARIPLGGFLLNDGDITNKDNVCAYNKQDTCANDKEENENDRVWNVMLFLTSLPENQNIDGDDDLTDSKWKAEYGGMLRFICPGIRDISNEKNLKTNWCESIRPVFNKAVIFFSNDQLYHEITPIQWSSDEKNFAHYFIHAKFLASK